LAAAAGKWFSWQRLGGREEAWNLEGDSSNEKREVSEKEGNVKI
jgi:hypothetical protein